MPAAPPPTFEEFTFSHAIRVRWAEVDAQQIVFNANYLLYFDIALNEYMRAIECLDLAPDLFLVHSELDYRRPGRFDDDLTLAARVAAIRRTSFHLRLAVFRGRDILVDGTNIYVHATGEPPAPMPLPIPFLARVAALERTPPTRP